MTLSYRSAVGLLAVAAVLACAPAADAVVSSKPADTYVTDGPVLAVAPTPSAVYIGGDFRQVGPRTGAGVGINASSAKSTGLPEIDGTVLAVARDGHGGFYVGGSFDHAGGLPRANLAHILANGTVDRGFGPDPDGEVHALAVSGSTVYAGGTFTSIGGKARSTIAALRASTGRATNWNPKPRRIGPSDPIILALAVSGSSVYAGGVFTSIGGKRRDDLAALAASNAKATRWNPAPGRGTSRIHLIKALAVANRTVYAGGFFARVGGEHRRNIAAISARTGEATRWNPNPDGGVYTLTVSGSRIYAGGIFRSIGGEARQKIAALKTSTGRATSWNPGVGVHYPKVNDIAVSGSTVYAAGDFISIGGQARSGLAAVDASTGQATAWNPNPNHPHVNALAVSGSTVYAGGSFNSINGRARNNIAALNPATGAVTRWDPDATGYEDQFQSAYVDALAASGSTVYAGGGFQTIGGEERRNLAALSASTGAATDWNPDPNGEVLALATSGSTVYAGGFFNSIGGQVRSGSAALDAGTGTATAWNPGATIETFAVAGPIVYAGGHFSSIGGRDRNGIAALDATTAAATGWNPNAHGAVLDLAITGSNVYAAGFFTAIGREARRNIAALSPSTGLATNWDPDAGDSMVSEVVALVLAGPTVYAGGGFQTVGGQARQSLAALRTSDGTATGWDPSPDGLVYALARGPDGSLWAGGTFTGFSGIPQSGIAEFKP